VFIHSTQLATAMRLAHDNSPIVAVMPQRVPHVGQTASQWMSHSRGVPSRGCTTCVGQSAYTRLVADLDAGGAESFLVMADSGKLYGWTIGCLATRSCNQNENGRLNTRQRMPRSLRAQCRPVSDLRDPNGQDETG
jgi:hypothetical protein